MTIQPENESPPGNYVDVSGLIEQDRVHSSLYTDPAIFDTEMRRIFENSWTFVGHESEIAEPGDYLTRRIGRQPVIVTRDKAGQVRVLVNRCTHRANLLCRAEAGNATVFRCPFHGWTFSNDGTVRGISFHEGYGEDLATLRGKLSLAQASQVATYGGFIFANLFGQPSDFDTYLGNARTAIDRLLGLSPAGAIELNAGWMKHRTAANWKIANEGQVDGYHPLFTHESLYKAVRPARVAYNTGKAQVATRDLGGGHSELDYSAEYRALDTEFGWFKRVTREKVARYASRMEEAVGADEARRRFIEGPPHTFIWPNLFLAEMQVMMVEPLAVNESIQYTAPVTLVGGEEMNPRILRNAEGAMGPAGFLIADDAEMGERNQLGLQAREPEWVIVSRGLNSEHQEDLGLTSYDTTCETPQRAIWKQYRTVMTEVPSA